MRYSVVIPTYNHCEDLLKPCLESIIKYTDLKDIEIIVVANGCTDNTKEYVESLGPSFKLIWEPSPLGFVKATNIGMLASTGDYVILLNNDTELLSQEKNQWLSMLEYPFREKNVGITGPSLMKHLALNSFGVVFYCGMISRKVIDKVGLLDEMYSPGGVDDHDYSERALRAGFCLRSIANFPIIHKENQTFKNHSEKYINVLHRNEAYFRKKFGQIDDNLNENNRSLPYLKYSIVVATSNLSETFLKPCIESILQFSEMGEVELIISAHGCNDASYQYINHLRYLFNQLGFGKHLKLVYSTTQLNYGEAYNAGISITTTDKIILINPDTVLLNQPRQNWLKLLESTLTSNTQGGIACIMLQNQQGFSYADLFCAMIDRKVFEKIGYFSTDYEESKVEIIDFSRSALAAGFKILQVPANYFPIYYAGQVDAVHRSQVTEWNLIFEKNIKKLREK